LIAIFFKCEACGRRDNLEVEQARRIRPFRDIAEELEKLGSSRDIIEEERADATQDSTTERTFEANTASTPLTENHTDPSSHVAASFAHIDPTVNQGDKGSLASSQKPNLLRWRSPKDTTAPIANLELALSIDARSIIAWTPHLASCYSITLRSWCEATIEAPDIVLAAGGVTKFAIVSEQSPDYMLSVYHCHIGERIGQPVILGDRAYSMAFSRDGSQFVVGCARGIHNFEFDGEAWWENQYTQILRKPKDKESRIDSQCINYSSDSSRLVVVTRYIPSGEVCIGVYDQLPRKLTLKGFSKELREVSRIFSCPFTALIFALSDAS
jgi:hypothetical protein